MNNKTPIVTNETNNDLSINDESVDEDQTTRMPASETVLEPSNLVDVPAMPIIPASPGDTSHGDRQPDPIAQARTRIAAQKGKLRGWRPLTVGDVAVVALEVLGEVRGENDMIGLRVMVAGRSADDIDLQGDQAASLLLHRRSVLPADFPFQVIDRGPLHTPDPAPLAPLQGTLPGDPASEMLSWPYRGLIIHVPMTQLPAIAGLATDTVIEYR